MTFLSRILGFIRDVVIAHAFGASISSDAFLIAFKIPNFMRRLFAEGAFSQAFIPVLSEYKTQREKFEVQRLVNHVTGSLGGILVLITVLGIILAPLLVMIFAPGFIQQTAKFALTVEMLKITFPYLLFIALTALAGSVLNTYGQFAIPAFTPVLLNITMISCSLWLTPYFDEPIMALAWGVFFAGIAQLLFQLPFLAKLDLLPKPKLAFQDEGVKRIHKLMIPALFGVSVSQVNLLIDTLMASFLVTGSVSWLYYADRLMEFPIGIFGVALSTVILPNLSKTVALGDTEKYGQMLDWALRWTFVVVTPAMLGLMILAMPILSTLFQNGAFAGNDVMQTTYALQAFSVGLLGFVLVKVLASGFYARQDTRTPVKIAVIAMLTNIILNLMLIIPFKHAGLALSTALAAIVNAVLLYQGLRRMNVYIPQKGWRKLLLRIALASLLMSVFLFWQQGELNTWLNMGTVQRALQLLMIISAGMSIYFLSLWVSGFRLHHIRFTDA